MPTFTQPLWGYALEYPKGWAYRDDGEVTAFASRPEALDPDYQGEGMGYLLIRPEFNPFLLPIEPRWSQYITKIAIMRGAKKLGASEMEVGNLRGYEAELLLPRKLDRRLWVGLLAAGGLILHLMVTHRKEERHLFQEEASRMVSSLRFVAHEASARPGPYGVPLPQAAQTVPLRQILADVQPDDPRWATFYLPASPPAAQVFFLREAPYDGWEVTELYPYPNIKAPYPFGRMRLEKDGQEVLIAFLPREDDKHTVLAIHQAAASSSAS